MYSSSLQFIDMDSFQFFLTGNKAARNIPVQIFVCTCTFFFLLGQYLEMEWLGHMVNITF